MQGRSRVTLQKIYYVQKPQLIVAGIGIALVLSIYFFANTIPPKKPIATSTEKHSANDGHDHSGDSVTITNLLERAKKRLNANQIEVVTRLENSVTRGDVNKQALLQYKALAKFWKDSAKVFEPYIYYTGQAAKLENSEKTLTFAAHQFLDNLMIEANSAMAKWLASNAKDLFEQALQVNPNNDSSKIGLGACYMLGGISDNPMQGILPVREITQKNPNNVYAQFILGLGGKKSGQYDKAAERFEIVVKNQPNNVEAMLHLAECYDLKGDKQNAIKWYTSVKGIIKNPDAQKELNDRISLLSK
jgi:tetratricopeptide (TPR) repeat protein